MTEDRKIFAEKMLEIGEKVAPSDAAANVEEVQHAINLETETSRLTVKLNKS